MQSADLEKLGLNRNEAKVYYGLLSLGQASAAELVKLIGVHRNIVYDNLEKLIEKGLVSFIVEGTKRKFIAERPSAIVEFFESKKNSLDGEFKSARSLFPEIEKLLNESRQPQDAVLFRGVNGIKKVLNLILESREYWSIGITNDSVDVLGETYWSNFNAKIQSRKIKEHWLMNSDFKSWPGLKVPQFTRILPPQMKQVTEIMVFENKTAITVYSKMPIALLIEAAHVADGFRKQFDVLWKFSKPL